MRTIRVALVLLFCVGVLVSAVAAETFHFTVTADPRSSDALYDGVLAAMKAKIGGQGAFQACVGDIDPPGKLRAKVTARFGDSAIWIPVVGNHELAGGANMTWIREEYTKGHDGRKPLKAFTKANGPAGSAETTYSFDYGNAHFVVLNQYWNGTTKSKADISVGGDVVPELLAWLSADLAANTKPAVFVLGHEPAYPKTRHVGDSLDQNKAHRDAFWKLLESKGVQAYFCGHTHYYSKLQQPGGKVWQIDAGSTRNASKNGNTFVDVTVSDKSVRYDVWRDRAKGSFAIEDTWSEPVRR